MNKLWHRFFLVTALLLSAAYDNAVFAASAENNVFTVNNIQVFYDAGNLKDSKKIAIDEGIHTALQKLLLTITPANTHRKVASLKPKILRKLVKKYQILNERMTSHSYMATINIEFEPDVVKSLLNSAGILNTPHPFDSFIIIPFLKNEMGWLWFKSEWKIAWNNLPEQVGMVFPSVISGNLQDIDSLDLPNLLTSPYIDFADILERYHVNELVLIEANQYESSVEAQVRFLGPTRDYTASVSYSQLARESLMDFYSRIVLDIVQKIDSDWKGDKKAFQAKLP